MLNITHNQARQRLKTLPEELRNFIFSTEIPDHVELIGKKNNLSDEKQKGLAQVISYVLLGFLHQEDCQKELQERLEINPLIASELQKILIRDIFSGVSHLLNGSYSPAIKNIPRSQKVVDSVYSTNNPISLENIPKPIETIVAPKVADASTPKPAFVPSIPPAALPTVTPASTPVPASPSSEPSAGISIKKSPLVFTGSVSPTPPSQVIPKPMPFVTQTNSQSVPVGNVPKFKVETPGTMSGSAFSGSTAPTFSAAPRPAKIELGFSSEEKKSVPTPASTFETQKSSIRYEAPVAPTFISTEPPAPSVQKAPTPAKTEPPKPLV